MAAARTDEQRAPAVVERFVKQLLITLKAVVLYPTSSSIPRENADIAVKLLGEILLDRAEVRLTVQKDGLLYGGIPVFPEQRAYESFARDLYNRGLSEIRFHTGVGAEQITRFLGLLQTSVDELASSGGFENRLWDLGVDAITVREATTRLVDAIPQADTEEQEEWPPAPTRIDEILSAAIGGRPRDERLLVRVISEPGTISAYLRETLTGRGVDPAEAVRQLKISEMARVIAKAEPGQRAALFRAVADAIGDLDPAARRALLTERLLPEARGDEHIASIVRHMDIDEMCRWLVENVAEDQVSVEGLARAIRNLALISLAERDAVFNAAGAAMRSAGLAEETVDGVLETVSPSRLEVRERPASGEDEDQPADSILQLVNMAPGSVTHRFEQDSEFLGIQDEARSGITDGDVVVSLVTLASVDAHGVNFGSLMSLLDDMLELSVERGDYDVAAYAAQSLGATLGDSKLAPERVARIRAALAKLTSPRELERVTKAMRVYPPDSAEYAACRRLIDALGREALEPMLNVLADEPDMTARKALVDMISVSASDLIADLGSHVEDPRWYFVRNVVAILGRTKDPAILPYLNRTLRHSDERVRRETIRALAGVQDRLSVEMLIAALSDSDGQNVQLAARYLGVLGERSAETALGQVALGEGRGNRDTGARVEAIEALGRLGSAGALSLLEDIAGKRSVIRAARARELRTAAEHAIAAIRSAGGGR